MALVLALGDDLAEELAACIERSQPDDRVAATAVRALIRAGHVTGKIFEVAFDHPDARVQANAIEELIRRPVHRWDGPLIERIEQGLQTRLHRMRAASIRGGMREPKLVARARSALLDMLDDDLTMHRVSAAWRAWRIRATDIAPRLRDLALRDDEPVVRSRCEWALRRLASDLRNRGAA